MARCDLKTETRRPHPIQRRYKREREQGVDEPDLLKKWKVVEEDMKERCPG